MDEPFNDPPPVKWDESGKSLSMSDLMVDMAKGLIDSLQFEVI